MSQDARAPRRSGRSRRSRRSRAARQLLQEANNRTYPIEHYKTNSNQRLMFNEDHSRGYDEIADFYVEDTWPLLDKILARWKDRIGTVDKAEAIKSIADYTSVCFRNMVEGRNYLRYLGDMRLGGLDWDEIMKTSRTFQYGDGELPQLSERREGRRAEIVKHAIPGLLRYTNEYLTTLTHRHGDVHSNPALVNFSLYPPNLPEIEEEETEPLVEDFFSVEACFSDTNGAMHGIEEAQRRGLRPFEQESNSEGRDEAPRQTDLEDEEREIQEDADDVSRSSTPADEDQSKPLVQTLREKVQNADFFVPRFATISSFRNVTLRTIDIILSGVNHYVSKTRQFRRGFFKTLNAAEKCEAESADETRKSNCRKIYMCKNGCKSFYGGSEHKCNICGYEGDEEYHWFVSPRVFCQLLYSDSETARIMKAEKTRTNGFGDDIWDSGHMKRLKETPIRGKHSNHELSIPLQASNKYFGDTREIALSLFTDGVDFWSSKSEEYSVYMIVVHNLPKEKRMLNKNVFIPMIVPRRQTKDNSDKYSFLQPLVTWCKCRRASGHTMVILKKNFS
jgi:hypothetical protein